VSSGGCAGLSRPADGFVPGKVRLPDFDTWLLPLRTATKPFDTLILKKGEINVCCHIRRLEQGCQMVYFQTKNSNLGKFWRVL
jgi:hypothetical protein